MGITRGKKDYDGICTLADPNPNFDTIFNCQQWHTLEIVHFVTIYLLMLFMYYINVELTVASKEVLRIGNNITSMLSMHGMTKQTTWCMAGLDTMMARSINTWIGSNKTRV